MCHYNHFINWCYNHGIKKLPNHWWTRWYYFRDTIISALSAYISKTAGEFFSYYRILINFQKFKVPLNPMYKSCQKVASHPAYQNSVRRKKFTVSFLKYKCLKLKLRVYCIFLACHSVAMVTCCVSKIIPTCSLVIGQFFDTMIVASIDKEW